MPDANLDHVDMRLSTAQRERAYSPSSCIDGNYQGFVEAYAQRSVAAHAQAERAGGRWLQVPYGSTPGQRMALCLPPASRRRPAAGCGLLVFIHGGYWQELSADDSLFAAAHCVNHGLAYCAVDYTLAPRARVGAMVEECRQAYRTLDQGAAEWGIDRRRIVVAGSSAGAHLAAMVCLPQWDGSPRRPAEPLAAVLLSGIYQLQPLVGTTINDALGMDQAEARALSPVLHALAGFPHALVAWGDNETTAFKRQSRDFARALVATGGTCVEIEIVGRNHFDVVLDLADPATSLGRQTLELFDQA